MKHALPVCLLGIALGGCMVGPDYQRPAFDLPAAYETQAGTPARETAIPRDWWTLYRDPELNRLVDNALTRGADLRLAVARVEEADATLREIGATLLPEVDLDEESTRQRSSSNTSMPLPAGTPLIRNSHRLTLGTAFELDFWGRLRRAREAARADALASHNDRDVVALTVAANTARLYFAVRSLQAQGDAARDAAAAQAEALDITRRRSGAGFASDIELNLALAASTDAAAQAREVERQHAAALHALAVLVGDLGLQLAPGALDQLPLPPAPPAGLPATLLERRPDVRQAEAQFAAANAAIGVARASQLPTFSLSADYGGESKVLNETYLRQSRIWSAGIGMSLPIFDAGKYAARTEAATARREQARANYQRAVENAFREVADTLVALRLSVQTDAEQQQRLAAARTSLQLARARHTAGYAYREVLDARQAAANALMTATRGREQTLADSVDMFKVLGGGWEAPH